MRILVVNGAELLLYFDPHFREGGGAGCFQVGAYGYLLASQHV